jgi:hypothetical protein
MKKVILVLLPLFLISCYDTEISDVLNENGIVIAKSFQPEINESASGVGISTGGDVSFTSTSVHVREKFVVVFRCDHGKIFKRDNLQLYEKLSEGDSVVITYREIYRVYDAKKPKRKRKELVNYKFIDANKK